MSARNESKAEKERQKQIQDKCQSVLNQLLRDEDNKYCVDCDAKGPRWASWNLGIFLCIRCAGIHRNLGVHISKVRSVNLDTWTPEQVVSLQQMGNSRARAVYEASLPDSWRRPQTDSSLETFIRAKYQHKKYIAKEWVPPPLPKVNWEKEIEEEAEKQKRKKKEKQQLASSLPPVKKVDVTVPALPKPSSSPKSTRVTAVNTAEKQSASVDLLGLSSHTITTSNSEADAEDVFSSFLSAPAQTSNPQLPLKITETNELTAEEDNFFNQPASAVTNDPKKPLSKDSIMALYASQAPAPQQPTMFHAAGMFSAQPTMTFTGANTGFAPIANTGFSNTGYQTGYLSSGPPHGNFPFAGNGAGIQAVPAGAQNPFFGMTMTMAPSQGFPPQHVSQTNTGDDLLADFNTPTALPEQMSGLNLGGPTSTPVGNSLSGFSAGSAFNSFNQRSAPGMGQTFTTQLWQ